MGVGLLVWYAAQGQIEGTISKGALIAFIMYNALFFRPIRQIADRFNTLQLGLVSTERLLKLLDNKDLMATTGTYAPAEHAGRCGVQKRPVCLQRARLGAQKHQLPREAGPDHCLCGRHRRGKTSIINLLSRFYDIQEGSICVDGRDLREHTHTNTLGALLQHLLSRWLRCWAPLGVGLLVWYAAQGQIEGTISKGALIAFIMYNALFFRPIRQIADRFNTLQLGLVSTERLLKLLDNQDLIATTGTYAPAELQGDVEFKNVKFAYNEPDWVLKDISFHVKPGQTIAFVGATGAGKTSIINLLSRFYDIQEGSICIDGRDLRDYDLSLLRRQIGVVLQDVFLFAGSIRDNITLGNKTITDAQIWEAADLVGARRFIERLPGALDYPVMERGATLSVGQRQLISFVRAMVYQPRVIVLDEATSSVDSETEELIQAAIEKLMQGRTSLVIAHRLSTIQKADKIIVLDKGEIKETGTHEELLRLEGGYYAQLYRMQYVVVNEELGMKNEELPSN